MRNIQVINKAEDYIEDNIGNTILLSNVADHVGMSPHHFHRVFKLFHSVTLKQFVCRVKLERSAIYLATVKGITITEIAYKYGYCDSSAYIRAFKRHFLMTPSQFKHSKKIQFFDSQV